MTHPRFSILIPTRERARTLAATLRSVVDQPFSDYEVIVMDNCGGPETEAVVRGFAAQSDKVRYHRSDTVLRMSDNWELGLSHCTGEYMWILGDDDALMPDGLVLADQILSRLDLELLHWDKYTYWWDDAIFSNLQGFLFVHSGFEVNLIDCDRTLADCYAWKTSYAALPCIYSSFVHRNVIERVRAKMGGNYFAPCPPDLFSGISNASVTKQAAHTRRGLSMTGNSGKSTGTAHFFLSLGEGLRNQYWKDEGVPRGTALDPMLIDTSNLEVVIADVYLKAKALLFPNDDRFQLHIPTVINAMIGGIGRDPDSYDKTVSDIRALAQKHGLDLERFPIPSRPGRPGRHQQGVVPGRAPNQPTVAVNCGMAGITDVAQASRLASGLLPLVNYLS
jgi:Glycosyl transferase family 2